jgi:hypothetical protein
MPAERIEKSILLVRGQRVILDADLAVLYNVSTKVLNQAVKRNRKRFPEDFMFQLTKSEKEEVVTNCDHLHRLKYSPVLPYVFTEHGVIMAANLLNSERAVEVSLHVVHAFVGLRKLAVSHRDLARRIDELEKKYETRFRVVFEAIRELMAPSPVSPKRRIGFRQDEGKE